MEGGATTEVGGVDLVAAYAALVATGALAWQIVVWLDRRKTKIAVEVNESLEEKVVDPINNTTKYEYLVTVKALNMGETTKFVDVIGLLDADDSSNLREVEPKEKALKAYQTLRQDLQLDTADQTWLGRKFVGFIRLKSGEQVVSETHSINPDRWELTQKRWPLI
jgi:hypothetical protein